VNHRDEASRANDGKDEDHRGSGNRNTRATDPDNTENDTTQSPCCWAVTPRQGKAYMNRTKSDPSLKRHTKPKVGKILQAWDQSTTHQQSGREVWKHYGGETLEPYLQSTAIALLNAEWLIDYAHNARGNAALPCRQDLPPEAFLT